MFDKFKLKINKEFILERVTEEAIFERYMGMRPDLIGTFRNPLRVDSSPGCVFYVNKQDRIKFKDYSRGWDWDCFNVVEYLFNISFKEAVERVAIDFGLTEGKVSQVAQVRVERRKEKLELRVKRREWNQEDKDYWYGKYYLTRKDLVNTSPISHAWYVRDGIIDPEPFYYYKQGDPCYAYHFPDYGLYEYKLYFPFRAKGRKFRQTNGDIIQGLYDLPPKGHILIITKSNKDRLIVNKGGKLLEMYGIASMSEAQIIPKELMVVLLGRFDYVFTLFDFDRAGIRLARMYKTQYDIPYLFFGTSFRKGLFKLGEGGVKDLADYVDIYKWEATLELIYYFYENRINS
jgi:hypothetical protein